MSLNPKDKLSKVNRYLFEEVSAIALSLFRICFGGVMFYEFGRLLWSPVGDVRYLDPIFHFKYPFFEWVVKGPDWLLLAVFTLGTACSVLIAIGLVYRYAAGLIFLCYSYLFLLDISFWNNHYYLYTVFLFFLILVNAHAKLSLDSILLKKKVRVLRWQVLLFQFQIIVVYFYGTLSKLVNPDWMSMRSVDTILTNSLNRNGIEVSEGVMQFLVFVQTYGGIGFDLIVGLLLLQRRTFLIGVFLSLVFHLTNHFFLNIGSFPFAMIGTLFLFIPEKWLKAPLNSLDPPDPNWAWRMVALKSFLIVFVLFQILFPLRHFTYDGLVFWTGEGKLGAWHMMSGSTTIDAKYFYLYEMDAETGEVIEMHSLETANFLSAKQQRTLGKWPFLIPQFANFLKAEGELAGMQNLVVKADIFVSRNGRKYKPIVNSDTDLTSLKRKRFGHNDWVLLYSEEHY